MTTAKFIYEKSDGTESPRLVLNARIIKDLKNDVPFLDHDEAKYLTGWEIDASGMTQEELKNYLEVVKDFFFEETRLENYIRDNKLDPSKVKFKTFSKSSIKQILLF